LIWISGAKQFIKSHMLPRQSQSPVPIDRCHLAQAIDVLGDRWSLLLLRSLLFGVRRFDDFQSELSIPRSVLSARLKHLSAHGLVTATPYREAGKRRSRMVRAPRYRR